LCKEIWITSRLLERDRGLRLRRRKIRSFRVNGRIAGAMKWNLAKRQFEKMGRFGTKIGGCFVVD
jgi:hypothetical protein